jgi:hypothetical protein
LLKICIPATPSPAAQYESLVPLLIELDGWQADDAEGMDMDMGATKMIQAVRTYSQGAKEVNAMVMVGSSMMTQMQGAQAMQMESADARVTVTTIDGFQVTMQHANNEDEGAVVVALGATEQQGATFILHYRGVSADGGLALAKRFDWKKLQQTANQLL